MIIKFIYNKRNGFTLLLASLVASIILSVGMAMYVIADKQLQLSMLARDSQYAFYAADTGAECALNLDFKGFFEDSVVHNDLKCNDKPIGPIGGRQYNGNKMEHEFYFEQTFSPGDKLKNRCIKVNVIKTKMGSSVDTKIIASGYSTPCGTDGKPTYTSRTLERVVEMSY